MEEEHKMEWDPEALGQALLHTGDEQWAAISNLDAFFTKVYNYYVEKGFGCIILSRITNLITLAFTIIFSVFLLVFVNWHSILFCSHSDTCELVGIRSDVLTHPSFWEVMVAIYAIIFTLYWLWHMFALLYAIRDAWEMHHFYHQQLHISDSQLMHIEWYVVVDKLVTLQETIKLCIVKDLTALDITNRIMRKENYFIAMINLNLLDFYLIPCSSTPKQHTRHGLIQSPSEQTLATPAPTPATALTSTKPKPTYDSDSGESEHDEIDTIPTTHTSKRVRRYEIFGKALEWNLRFAILNSMFDSQFAVRKGFLGDHGIVSLRRRFIFLGLLNLILMPFIMIFMVIFFFLKHAEELHSKKTLFGPRQWTPLAYWRFREFNELSHVFDRRLTLSAEPAQTYIRQFPSTMIPIVAQCVAYVSGAIVAILLLFTFFDSSLLLNLTFWDRTLLWYLALFSAILALSRSMIPDKNYLFHPTQCFQAVYQYTHYLPKSWRGRTHTYAVQQEFAQLYRTRVSIFLNEMMCVLLTPYILCWKMPTCAEQIVKFVQDCTVQVNGVGHLCTFAMFDFEHCGDQHYSLGVVEKHETPTDDTKQSDTNTPHQPTQRMIRSRQGKMEKSFLSFAMNNPKWKTDGDGQHFLANMADSLQQSRQPWLARYGYGTAPLSPLQLTRNASTDSITPPSRQRGIRKRKSPTTTDTDGHEEKQNTVQQESPADQHEQEVEDSDGDTPPSHSHDSIDLSESNRHLIESFSDLLAMNATITTSQLGTPTMTSSIAPSIAASRHLGMSRSLRPTSLAPSMALSTIRGVTIDPHTSATRRRLTSEQMHVLSQQAQQDLFTMLEENVELREQATKSQHLQPPRTNIPRRSPSPLPSRPPAGPHDRRNVELSSMPSQHPHSHPHPHPPSAAPLPPSASTRAPITSPSDSHSLNMDVDSYQSDSQSTYSYR